MKKIGELGISPYPWRCEYTLGDFHVRGVEYDSEYGKTSRIILTPNKWDSDAIKKSNTMLSSAAPELYDCLREAVVERCRECEDKNVENCRGKCFVAKWRDALEKASGAGQDLQD